MKKCIQNYTFEELKEVLPNIPYEKIKIVYEFYHRSKIITADSFARQHCISRSTLYRYIKDIEAII